jgi:glycerophosphoryl diester phosphodiesterase
MHVHLSAWVVMNPLLDLTAHPVIGHRGASGLAPENTREALQLAIVQGADALEFDVRLSADSVPVLMHDPTLNRTTPAKGPVGALSASALSGLGVPTLAEVLEEFRETPLLIELKTVEVAIPVRRILLARAAAERVVLASFLDQALAPFRDGQFNVGASRRGILSLWLRSKVGLPAPQAPVRLYAVPDRYKERVLVPTRQFIRRARDAGKPVHVWTVNDAGRAAELWKQGVSGIITNYPALIRAERDRLFAR